MVSLLALLTVAMAGVDSIAGLWAIDTSYGPRVRGELTLEREASAWHARIAAFDVPAHVAHDSVSVVLPDSQGRFVGHLRARSRVITGWWVQPPGPVSRVAYATPATLQRVDAHNWRGRIEPLDERYALYMLVVEDANGSHSATFRVPERNYLGGQSYARYRITLDGDSMRFVDSSGTYPSFAGVYDVAQHRATLHWPALDEPVTLTPRLPDQAAGLYPRLPTATPYAYRAPLKADDGWRTAPAHDLGMDESALAALVQGIATTDPAPRTAPLIQSLLIARHGRLVLDEYFFGFDADRLHDLRSASKTITSVMLGAAIARDHRFDMDSPVYPIFAAKAPFANPDARKARIRVADLLTHSTGLACDDNDDASPGNEDRMYSQTAQPDWYKYILDLPVVHDPGTTYAYCSGGINVAGGLVRLTSHTWLPEFFARTVAEPLQIRRWAMNLTPTGEGYSGGGLYLRPRDLLKLGVAFLNRGVWNGHRLVSADWVRQSTARHITTRPESADGYGWHCNTLHAPGGRTYEEYEASGNGGQLLIVVPALDLAVVFTAANYNRYPIWRMFREQIVPQQIITAIDGP